MVSAGSPESCPPTRAPISPSVRIGVRDGVITGDARRSAGCGPCRLQTPDDLLGQIERRIRGDDTARGDVQDERVAPLGPDYLDGLVDPVHHRLHELLLALPGALIDR